MTISKYLTISKAFNVFFVMKHSFTKPFITFIGRSENINNNMSSSILAYGRNVLSYISKRFVGFNVTPETEIRLLKDHHSWTVGDVMSLSNAKLKEKESKNKILVQILSQKWNSIPLFKLMSHSELESLLHKGRKERSEVRYVTEKQGRIREKITHLSPTASEQETEYVFKQIKKWLTNGHHVNIHISDKDPKFASDIQARLKELESQEESLGTIQFKVDHKK